MKALFIEATREGYSPDQCEETLTVGELIAILEQFDEDRLVFTRHDNGYTYGSIKEREFNTSEDLGLEEDEEY